VTTPPGELVDALADPARRHAAAAELRRHRLEAVVALRAALGGPLTPDHRRAVLGVLGELKAPDAADACRRRSIPPTRWSGQGSPNVPHPGRPS
jgi:hypothetical protein